MGRARKPIDLARVERLAAAGATDQEIARKVGVSEATLKIRAREALDRGRARFRVLLRRLQLRAALRGSVPMLIFLGKNFLGQSDRETIVRGEPLEVVEQVIFPRAVGE
jgi:DNA-binding Lrp family transcriptional regulator